MTIFNLIVLPTTEIEYKFTILQTENRWLKSESNTIFCILKKTLIN